MVKEEEEVMRAVVAQPGSPRNLLYRESLPCLARAQTVVVAKFNEVKMFNVYFDYVGLLFHLSAKNNLNNVDEILGIEILTETRGI